MHEKAMGLDYCLDVEEDEEKVLVRDPERLVEASSNENPNGDIHCLEFDCDQDLSKYVDSMLFESGTNIAKGTFAKGTENLEVYLDVRGEVSVTYKDEVYFSPEEFPDELKDLIKEHPNQWFDDDDIYVGMNNWFEYIFDNDGEVFEEDLSETTPEKILDDMIYLANEYFEKEK